MIQVASENATGTKINRVQLAKLLTVQFGLKRHRVWVQLLSAAPECIGEMERSQVCISRIWKNVKRDIVPRAPQFKLTQ